MLHGLGSDGNDRSGGRPLAAALPDARLFRPTHPKCAAIGIRVQWFDISLDGDRLPSANRRGERTARARGILDDLEANRHCTRADHLAGFSQGLDDGAACGPVAAAKVMGVRASRARSCRRGVRLGRIAKPPVAWACDMMKWSLRTQRGCRHGASAGRYDVHYHVSRGVAHGIAPDGLDLPAPSSAGCSEIVYPLHSRDTNGISYWGYGLTRFPFREPVVTIMCRQRPARAWLNALQASQLLPVIALVWQDAIRPCAWIASTRQQIRYGHHSPSFQCAAQRGLLKDYVKPARHPASRGQRVSARSLPVPYCG